MQGWEFCFTFATSKNLNFIKMKKLFILLAITLTFVALIKLAEYQFGADKVFVGMFISMPLLLIWCIKTDYRTKKNKNVLNRND